ncbi:hypothetical protein [Olivibacter jilunii]|uniref:hypothetical protein n=1 Tax=Olivibacter jilunii TaxID=985016 RepID=UPI001031D1A8|nr:hypothetical protein [Olivibacter jilunii]
MKGKWIGISVLCMMLAFTAEAQTFSEWFKQKKTRKKYMAQQIAALKVYKEYIEEGWEIAQNGLGIVEKFKGGEFGLHQLFFGSLKAINPIIKRYPKIADIIAMQVAIIKVRGQYLKEFREGGFFREGELEFMQSAYARLLEDGSTVILELTDLTTNGKLEMKDDERINRINALYDESVEQYRFARRFGEEAQFLSLSRKNENREADVLKSWLGLEDPDF